MRRDSNWLVGFLLELGQHIFTIALGGLVVGFVMVAFSHC